MAFGLIMKSMNGFRFTKKQEATLSVASCFLELIAISEAPKLKSLRSNDFNFGASGLSAKR
jgi:hypothetical protein